ncbi:maintenance of mitochondrial structure and function-domain-containing protein [Chytriomyces sp. MP71]|nr:maintenance of mitochondrial structure and function-domain-containing protein [Chytriomyces sp. MP71]
MAAPALTPPTPAQTQPSPPLSSTVFDGLRESTSGFIVTLHPLVILNLTDHLTRLRMQHADASSSAASSSSSASVPVTIFGAVIGTQSGREIEIFNSYELPYKWSDSRFVVDMAYFLAKQDQFKQVFPNYDLLGWYSVGEVPSELDLHVHKQFLDHNDSPLFLQLNPIMNASIAKDLPISIFESVVDITSAPVPGTNQMADVEGAAAGSDGNAMKFAKSKYKIETGEAERIALDHVARVTNADGDRGSSLVANLTGQKNAIKMLHARMQILKAYVRDVDAGILPCDHGLLRQIASVCQRLPVMNSDEFRKEFVSDYNDILLGAYLAAITKGTNAVNELVDKINVATADRKGSKGPRGAMSMFL